MLDDRYFVLQAEVDPHPETDPRPETDPCTVTIDGLRLTPCWRYKTKEYVISSIVGSSRRGGLTLSVISQEIDCKPRIRQARSHIKSRWMASGTGAYLVYHACFVLKKSWGSDQLQPARRSTYYPRQHTLRFYDVIRYDVIRLNIYFVH